MNTANNITFTTTDRIVVSADSAITLTLDSVDVTSSGYTPLEVNTNAAVTIALSGTNVLTSTAAGSAGLQNTASASLTITSASGDGETTGTLTATGGSGGAGIGGDSCNITISGGEVKATGGEGGAGIGGDSCNITISGGKVTAIGGEGGAGIGGGTHASGITITGGYIIAAGSNASAIGGGNSGSAGTITITGGCFGTGVIADSTDPVGSVYTIAPANGYYVASNPDGDTNTAYPCTVTVCTYTVTLESNGGKITEGSEVTSYVYGIGATLPDSDSISREGYTFGGWYEESDFSGSAVTGIGTSDYGNKTYYACWNCTHNFSYSYNVSGGASENSKVLTATCSGCEGTLTYTLAAPEESSLIYDGNSHDATVSLGEEDALYSYASDTSTVLPKTLTITYSYSDTESGTKESVSETKAAGYYTANITLGGVTASVSYQVSQASISESDFIINTDGETYTGSAITKTIRSSLTEGTDYSVTYAGNTNAGTATITITGSGNYTGELICSFTINQKELTASINGTTSKVYDGTTAVTDNQNLSVTLNGVVDGDEVSVSASGYAYDTASVGTDKTITANGLTLSGSKAGNYTLADTSVTSATVSGSITAKEITVSITPNGGIYGGTITAATATLDGVITADEDSVPVTLTYIGTANDESTEYNGTEVPTLAGTYTVTATISDANYSLTGTTTAEFVVEKAAPTITLSEGTAVYTGETVAYGDVAAGEALVGEAAVTLVNGETYDAAINGAITYTYYTDEDCTILTGSEGETASGAAGEGAAPINAGMYYVKASIEEQDNYTAAVSTAAKLTIEPKTVELTWSMLTESELVYDGSAKTLTASVDNLASGDEVSVTVVLTDGTDNVNVTEEGFNYIAAALTGADSGNYCLPDDEEDKTSATYYITSVELTSASVEQSGTLIYDGTAQAADVIARAETVDGTNDDVTFTYSTLKNGEYSTEVPAFTDAGTYTVYYRAEAASHATVSGSFTVTIGVKSVTASVSGTTEKTYDGTTDTTTDQGLSIKLSGVVDGDTVTATAESCTYDSANVDSASTITAAGITLSGEDAGNYELTDTTVTTEGTITAKKITVSITANGGTYGGAITAATATLDGVTDADESSVDVALTYTGTANDGTVYESTTAPTLAGTYKVTATISESNYSLTGTTTAKFKIARATYDMSGVSFVNMTYIYDGTEKTLTITGTLPDGVTVTYTDNTLTNIGSATATAIFTGDTNNYETIEPMTATLTVAVLTDLLEQDFPDEDAVHKVEVQEGLSEVPEALQENPDLDTVEEIEAFLKTEVTAAEGYTTENSAVYDVTLMISFDGGLTWRKATAENFPADGLQVLLPYPEGTGRDTHDFVVTHMFTTTDFGKTPGDTENPAVTKTDEGLLVTVTGLSPIVIAWKEVGTETETEIETETETETETEIETETETETETEIETE
ncbi:MAG: YDG domain-containing protein, partial [Lachnospiraceae bacterium]|nr:YDG domain-containing protein [Lachnospiraceae bacterium]